MPSLDIMINQGKFSGINITTFNEDIILSPTESPKLNILVLTRCPDGDRFKIKKHRTPKLTEQNYGKVVRAKWVNLFMLEYRKTQRHSSNLNQKIKRMNADNHAKNNPPNKIAKDLPTPKVKHTKPKSVPESEKRYIDEGLAGSRKDNLQMRYRQSQRNRTTK